MLLRLFQIRKTYKDIKEARNNPRGFVMSEGKNFFLGLSIPFLLPGVFFILVSAIFAFTPFLNGPYMFAKVLFWIFLIPTVIIFLVLRKIFKVFSSLNKTTKKTDTPVSAVYDENGKRIG